MITQQPHFCRITGSPHERRGAKLILRIGIGAAIEQQFHQLRTGVQSGLHQSRDALSILTVRISGVPNEGGHGPFIVGAERFEEVRFAGQRYADTGRKEASVNESLHRRSLRPYSLADFRWSCPWWSGHRTRYFIEAGRVEISQSYRGHDGEWMVGHPDTG